GRRERAANGRRRARRGTDRGRHRERGLRGERRAPSLGPTHPRAGAQGDAGLGRGAIAPGRRFVQFEGMATPHAVIFDLGGTLVHWSDGDSACEEEWAASYDLLVTQFADRKWPSRDAYVAA